MGAIIDDNRGIHMRYHTLGRALLAVASASAVGLVPAAAVGSAKTKTTTIKLTGVVTGTEAVRLSSHGLKETVSVVSVRQGKHKRGTLLVSQQAVCGGPDCQFEARADLSVGRVRGTARFALHFTLLDCIVDGTCKPAKFGKGTLSGKHGSETLKVLTGTISTRKGSKFAIVLTY